MEYLIGAKTASLPGPFEAVVPIENPDPKNNYFLLVTRGNVRIHYTGQASMHDRSPWTKTIATTFGGAFLTPVAAKEFAEAFADIIA